MSIERAEPRGGEIHAQRLRDPSERDARRSNSFVCISHAYVVAASVLRTSSGFGLRQEARTMASNVTQAVPAAVTPKLLRQLHAALIIWQTELSEEQRLLERLWYKSHAQFRNAKWLQRCDAVRRRLKRLCGDVKGFERRASGSKQAVQRTHGLIGELMDSTATVYTSLWSSSASSQSQPSSSTRLPKFASPPDSSPSHALISSHLVLSLQLTYVLCEVKARASSAFALMEAHIRTPPAPTFAPIVMTLLAICAKVEALCHRAVPVQPPSDATPGEDTASPAKKVAELLARSYHALRPKTADSEALDGPPESILRCTVQLQQTLNQPACKAGDQTWQKLPSTLSRRDGGIDLHERRKHSRKCVDDGVEAIPLPPSKKRKGLYEELMEDQGTPL